MADDDVSVPVVGSVNKHVLYGIGGVAIAYVGYQYYRSRSNVTADNATDTTDPGFADGGTIPSVAGAVSDTNGYGDGGVPPASTADYGFTGTTNDEWTQYATTQLEQSDIWSYSDIVTALGAYLAGSPLTNLQRQIVEAAIGVAGQPPVGTHVFVPGGNVPLTVAPTGVTVLSTTSNSATIGFNKVAGAGYYRVYRSGASTNVGAGDGSPITITGLQPNTTYSFAVAADTTSGVPGPKSASVNGKTKAIALTAPTGLHATKIASTSVVMTCNKVANATYYHWYVNGVAHGASDSSSYTISSLKPKTKYVISVAADTTSNSPGPQSGKYTVTTKSK